MSFRPKTRLEKILRGQDMKARSALEESVQIALANAGGVLETNATLSVDSETGKQMITTDITAAELFGACAAGKKVLAEITLGDAPGAIRKTISLNGQVFGDDEEAVYEFTFAEVDGTDGAIGFIAEKLSADDTVVFHEV